MQKYVVREPLHQNGKFHGHFVGNSGPKPGSIGLCSKNFNFRASSSLHSQIAVENKLYTCL